MKKLVVLLCVLSLFSCNSQNKQNQSNREDELYNNYNKAYANAAKSPILIDTIFMGLRFGMSKSEVNDHLSKMRDNGKIKTDDIGRYEYILSSGRGNLSTSLSADFFNDKLYKFTLNFNGLLTNGVLVPIDGKVSSNIAKGVFLNKIKNNNMKYKSYYYTLSSLGTFSAFIEDNLLIEFSPLGSMSYINIPSEKEKERSEAKSQKDQIDKSISDL